MKNYDEIKEIITKKFGITSLDAYSEFLRKWRAKEWIPTQEDLEILSPDDINCRDFWKLTQDLFGMDSVCNIADGNKVENRIDSNRTNLSIARHTGMLNLIDDWRQFKMKVLEYGAGFGSLKNYIESTTCAEYYGFDVFPKCSDISETTEQGYIPAEFVESNKGKFQLVVSTNVMQHVSEKQKLQFIKDAATLLVAGGMLSFNLPVDTNDASPIRYGTLYGQFIEVPKISKVMSWIEKDFSPAFTTTRHHDMLVGFTCVRKQIQILPALADVLTKTE